MGQFETSLTQVRQATAKHSEMVDHTSDRAVLYHLNARAVLGFRLVRDWMENVVNYHRGKPYVRHVEFERLFSPDFHCGG